ncbi:hypothetical protein KKC87_03135, partial [Patescibacteria group bacterium]|nr:hypothetical protein [Patescibacteria group bacterium]
MIKIIKFAIIILAITVFLILLISGLGYSAIRYNFWPPFCEILSPIRQAERVCEFSKLEKAKKGVSASVTFWLSADPETEDTDRIFLVIR